MSPEISTGKPVLAYTRIAQNRYKSILLIALSIGALVPFVAGISFGVSYGIMRQLGPSPKRLRARIQFEEAYYDKVRAGIPDDERVEFDDRYEKQLRQDRAELARHEAEDPPLMLKLILAVGAAVTAALCLLLWAVFRSPTAKVLSDAGAWPAASGEAEAARLIEKLSSSAGLPTPKLYVIEAGAPNAFAAGMHPEHAVMAITRGALKLLDQRELEGVLAHELSHIGNHDIRLNAAAASVALFLRIPYLMFRRSLSAGWNRASSGSPGSAGFFLMRRGFRLMDLALSPLALYVLVIAPVLGTLVRAAISRQREYLADADAALLAGSPEGLMRALAKIGGAGSGLPNSNPAFSHFYFADPAATRSWFSHSLLATHPRLGDRIQRLASFQGATALLVLEAAVQEGRRHARQLEATQPVDYTPGLVPRDELDSLNRGAAMGRVVRVISAEPVPLYDDIRAGIPPMVTARIKPGALIVAFDDPGKMRQVNTADQIFGYIDRSVKLVPLENVIPAEIYDPKTRAAVEAKLPPLDAAAVRAAAKAAAAQPNALTTKHLIIFGVIIFVIVFAGMFLYLEFGS
jgi:heat shock protein HtpX